MAWRPLLLYSQCAAKSTKMIPFTSSKDENVPFRGGYACCASHCRFSVVFFFFLERPLQWATILAAHLYHCTVICLLSVQCYVWTECKFTCVCVCVSITLSLNSPTGQTHQRIFTVDSLKDADLRKNVPFGGHDDE